ncbi:MAG: type III-B CRISPR module RAMP protein Cmr1 [Firmicutes bacterium]|nr:type III-B CRISPR module RAMP protein Cmr1 [Bacillota bacterium]
MFSGKKRMEEVRLRVVTPLFMGGARTEITEFRPPSLKGALRFWFRAKNPDKLQEEARIFGSTEAGQASFLIQLLDSPVASEESINCGKGLSYLGYGLVKRGKIERSYIKPGEEIVLRIVFRPNVKQEVQQDVMESMRCLCLLGGLGSRSRRGLGSVVLPSELPVSSEELCDQIAATCQRNNLPEEVSHTAFSQRARIVIPFKERSWQGALEKIGGELQAFRSFQTPPPNGPRFKRDHDLIYGAIKGNAPTTAPERVTFGLPQNYYFSSLKGARAGVTGANRSRNRRASPLLIHTHLLADGQHAVVVSFLPAPLLPSGDDLTISTGKGYASKEFTVPVPEHWTAVESFMNHLAQLPGAVEVKF